MHLDYEFIQLFNLTRQNQDLISKTKLRSISNFENLSSLKTATYEPSFCRKVHNCLTPTKSWPVCGSSRQLSDNIFCREQRLCVFDPKMLADKKKIQHMCGGF